MRTPGIALIAFVCACVAGLDLGLALAPAQGIPAKPAREEDYNRLVRGFESGHLYIAASVPAGMAALPDPYDPERNRAYRLGRPSGLDDTSYFRGRAYLYFGVTPALIAFWPWHRITGGFLSQKAAVAVFALAGFFASAALLLSVRRRHFPGVSDTLAAGAVLVLGTATTVPMLLARSGLWEVPASGGYALSMLALGAAWLAATGLMAGLAVGARPTLVFGMTGLVAAAALFGPDWGADADGDEGEGGVRVRGRGRLAALLAAGLPLALIGAGLGVYNQARFGSPFEFGEHYQLCGDNAHSGPLFSPVFYAENLRLYLFSTMHWGSSFPFAWASFQHVFTGGHVLSEFVIGIVPSLPILLLAAAVPFAWMARVKQDRSDLRLLAAILACMAASSFAGLLGFWAACNRYEVDFLPALALLACLGLFACSGPLGTGGPSTAGRILRPLIGALLLYSCAAPTLAALSRGAYSRQIDAGLFLLNQGRDDEGIGKLEAAVRTAHRQSGLEELGQALVRAGRNSDAFPILAEAHRLAPDNPDILYSLGWLSFQFGKTREAIGFLEGALRVRPTKVEAIEEMGCDRLLTGDGSGAIGSLREALGLDPGNPLYSDNLGLAYLSTGHPAEALPLLEYASRRNPGLPNIRRNLAEARRLLAGNSQRAGAADPSSTRRPSSADW